LTQLLGEYSNSPCNLPTPPERDASDIQQPSPDWPDDLIDKIKAVMNTTCDTPSPPEFSFEFSDEGKVHNLAVLKKYDFDLGKALEAQQSSSLGYGKEFKPPAVLKEVFGLHPLWKRMEAILTNGSKWPVTKISKDKQQQDLLDALDFKNHKGASAKPELLKKLIAKDVKYGYSLPIPLEHVTSILGLAMAPMNIMAQNTINELGRIFPKDQLTHDQSWKWSSGTLVNSRVQKELLQATRYGFCIRQIINWAVATRRKYPGQKILVTKIDYKSAYRRGTLHYSTALQTATQLPEEKTAIITLRHTFGGAPCPFKWGVVSESICDLANALLQCDNDWDPSELHSSVQHEIPT
jgi:hypothetical protein